LTGILNSKSSSLIKDIKTQDYLVIEAEENLIDVMEKCKDFVGESIPVIDENRRLLGIFSENDLFIYYSKAQEMRKTEETKA
jgi:Mg/Co/Ni transporter MgtE